MMVDMFRNINYLILIIINFSQMSFAIEATCRGKRFAETCRSDEDCEGPNDRCIQGRCTCALNFDKFVIGDKMQMCRPAPNQIGASCEMACKAPLVCSQGKCICWKGEKTANGQCTTSCPQGQTLLGQECRTVSYNLGTPCNSDGDCATANSYCNRGRCDCVPGSFRQGSNFCRLDCPDGSQPTQTCKKIMVNDPSAMANSEKMDSCPKGYACATYGKPDIGHCCKLYCPYGYPDLSKSCNGEGVSYNHCSLSDTHYCQEFYDHGTRNVLCCPRPCREPTPLYINNRCYPMAHLGDACQTNAECEGGLTMNCQNGYCRCKIGYRTDNNGKFPTCKKPCLLGANVDGACFRKVRFGEPCLASSMCPRKSVCREGLCQCDCSSALSANKCINPDDPMNFNSIINTFADLLGAKSRR